MSSPLRRVSSVAKNAPSPAAEAALTRTANRLRRTSLGVLDSELIVATQLSADVRHAVMHTAGCAVGIQTLHSVSEDASSDAETETAEVRVKPRRGSVAAGGAGHQSPIRRPSSIDTHLCATPSAPGADKARDKGCVVS